MFEEQDEMFMGDLEGMGDGLLAVVFGCIAFSIYILLLLWRRESSAEINGPGVFDEQDEMFNMGDPEGVGDGMLAGSVLCCGWCRHAADAAAVKSSKRLCMHACMHA